MMKLLASAHGAIQRQDEEEFFFYNFSSKKTGNEPPYPFPIFLERPAGIRQKKLESA